MGLDWYRLSTAKRDTINAAGGEQILSFVYGRRDAHGHPAYEAKQAAWIQRCCDRCPEGGGLVVIRDGSKPYDGMDVYRVERHQGVWCDHDPLPGPKVGVLVRQGRRWAFAPATLDAVREDQAQAFRDYAAWAHAVVADTDLTWKDQLRHDWMRAGSHWDGPYHLLHQARNNRDLQPFAWLQRLPDNPADL